MFLRKIVLLAFVLTGFLQAQFTKNVEISSHYDDNLYRSPLPTTDVLTDASIGLAYTAENSDLSFYYKGSLNSYRENSLRNFTLHNIGLNYFSAIDDSERHGFYIGADWTSRLNGDEYSLYNYNQIFAYTNFQFDLDWFFLKTGYNFRYRNYLDLADLTNSQQFIFLQANKSLPTRTTFILETHLGYKSFAGSQFFTSTSSTRNGGRGRGRMTETNSEVTSTQVSDTPGLSQAIVLARVSQSLHEKVGLFL